MTIETDIGNNRMLEAQDTIYPMSWRVGLISIGCLNLLASVACFFFVVSILGNKQIRQNAYNLYVAFIIIPDGLFTLSTFFSYLIQGMEGRQWFPDAFVYASIFIWFFYYSSNIYLNGIIVHDLDNLIHKIYKRIKVQPPCVKRVYRQVAAVYVLAALLATWAILPVPWSFFHIASAKPLKRGLGSPPGGWFTPFSATLMSLTVIMIPVVYVTLVRLRIWRKNLLPKRGRTRVLSAYFMRIIVIFFFFYVPSMISATIFGLNKNQTPFNFWMYRANGVLNASQATITLYMVSKKDDLRKAVLDNLPAWIRRRSEAQGSSLENSFRTSVFRMQDLQQQQQQSTSEDDQVVNEVVLHESEWDQDDVFDSDLDRQEPEKEPVDEESGCRESSRDAYAIIFSKIENETKNTIIR